jgi:hypothetical protein
MRTARSLSKLFSALVMAVCLVVLSTGCSKKCDDHAQPQDNTSSASNRAPETAPVMDQGSHSSGVSFRGMEDDGTQEGEEGDEGISDDGDDEANGEGSNKKGRH